MLESRLTQMGTSSARHKDIYKVCLQRLRDNLTSNGAFPLRPGMLQRYLFSLKIGAVSQENEINLMKSIIPESTLSLYIPSSSHHFPQGITGWL